MSQSLSAKPLNLRLDQRLDAFGITREDLLFAAGLHVAIVILLALASLFASSRHDMPEFVSVTMVTPAELAQQQRAAKKHATAPKPDALPDPAKKAVPAPKEEEFDPFAPVESSSDVTTERKEISEEMSELLSRQLTSSEYNRYVAMMQRAIEKRWKAPGNLPQSTADPLVEMVLTHTGGLASVRIIESSGHAGLDESLIRAIQAAAPFTIPAEQFELFRINRMRFHPIK